MKCPKCSQEIPDNSRYCSVCGEKVAQEPDSLDEAVFSALNAQKELEKNYAEEFRNEQKAQQLQKEVIIAEPVDDYPKEAPAVDEVAYTEIPVETAEEEEPVITVDEAPRNEPKPAANEWYYVSGEESRGPYSETEMISMIQSGRLNAKTYVWTEGMANWQRLQETRLAGWLPYKEEPKQTRTQSTSYSYPYRLQSRNILLYVILSVVTCGIFNWIWLYFEARDVNDILYSQNKPLLLSPGAVVLLSMCTFGLFPIYYFYKAGTSLSKCTIQGSYVEDNGILLGIFALFYWVISLALLQLTLNDFARYSR